MDFDHEETLFPIGAVIYGSLVVLFTVLILSTFLAVFAELGWTGIINWPNNTLYLLILFIAVILGSLMGGWRSRQKGWAVGIGVGFLSSILLLFLTLFLHERLQMGIFLIKTMICMFIGAFGGIIGVNFSNNKV